MKDFEKPTHTTNNTKSNIGVYTQCSIDSGDPYDPEWDITLSDESKRLYLEYCNSHHKTGEIEPMKHWFCFSFIGTDINSGCQANGCAYTGYASKNITLDMIKENKRFTGLKDSAVLVSISYLGLMTKSEFTGNKDSASIQ